MKPLAEPQQHHIPTALLPIKKSNGSSLKKDNRPANWKQSFCGLEGGPMLPHLVLWDLSRAQFTWVWGSFISLGLSLSAGKQELRDPQLAVPRPGFPALRPLLLLPAVQTLSKESFSIVLRPSSRSMGAQRFRAAVWVGNKWFVWWAVWSSFRTSIRLKVLLT